MGHGKASMGTEFYSYVRLMLGFGWLNSGCIGSVLDAPHHRFSDKIKYFEFGNTKTTA